MVKNMSKEQRAALLAQLQTEEKNERMAKRESYEAIRDQFMHDVQQKVEGVEAEVSGFKKWLDEETGAFTKLMREYGAVKSASQQSYTITSGDFKLELERNKTGDLDYKSISKLYELEDKFDEEYAEIMRLFKEANVVQTTATNYYFSKRNAENGVWTRIEPSFCRL